VPAFLLLLYPPPTPKQLKPKYFFGQIFFCSNEQSIFHRLLFCTYATTHNEKKKTVRKVLVFGPASPYQAELLTIIIRYGRSVRAAVDLGFGLLESFGTWPTLSR